MCMCNALYIMRPYGQWWNMMFNCKWEKKNGKMKTLCSFILCNFYENLTQPLWICQSAYTFNSIVCERWMIRAILHSTLLQSTHACRIFTCVSLHQNTSKGYMHYLLNGNFSKSIKFESIRAFVCLVYIVQWMFMLQIYMLAWTMSIEWRANQFTFFFFFFVSKSYRVNGKFIQSIERN